MGSGSSSKRNTHKPTKITITKPRTPKEDRIEKVKPKKNEPEWPIPKVKYDDHFNYRNRWPKEEKYYSIDHIYMEQISSIMKGIEYEDFIGKTTEKYYHQKETDTDEIGCTKLSSGITDSAHVQSTFEAYSHACINLSTSQETDVLLQNLTLIHVQSDTHSHESETLISQFGKETIQKIIIDTRSVQQDLLKFGKRRQKRQDDIYQEWLQKYIEVLDQWKSEILAQLQIQLERYQLQILNYSQQLINRVNIGVISLKESVRKQEQTTCDIRINQILGEMQMLSKHHLGTETMTKINLIIRASVGNKLPGESCHFDSFDDQKHDEDKTKTKKKILVIKNTTNSIPNVSSVSTVVTNQRRN